MHWYNPTTRAVEDRPAPFTDEEALEMLRGDITTQGPSWPSTTVFVRREWASSRP